MRPDFRELKRQARNIVHETMAQPALYLETTNATPIPVTVRFHTSMQALGALARGEGYAQVESLTPRMIFLLAQVKPRQGSFVILADMGAYRLGVLSPEDDITQTAEVAMVPKVQCSGLGWQPDAPYMGFAPPSIV